MMEEKEYSPETVKKYLKKLKNDFPNMDYHFLEVAMLQYLLMDCDENYKPDENIKMDDYSKKEYHCVYFNDEIKHIS